MLLNPQVQSRLSQSKFSSKSKLVAFETFQKQKNQRKQIQSERKNIELNVSHLYRQAKKASKQLGKTQAALIQTLNKKSSKEEEQRLKQEYQRLKQEELHQMRNNNSLSRYMNMLKKEEAKRRLVEHNKEVSLYVKEREKHDFTLKRIKEIEQNQMIQEKNLALQSSLRVGVQLAKTKKLYEKKCLSSVVRNDLLEIQNRKIQKQRSVIGQLINKKKELKQLFSKAKLQSHKYQTLLEVGKSRPLMQMYELMAGNEGQDRLDLKKRKKSHRKRKYFSQSKIINSYLGTLDQQQ